MEPTRFYFLVDYNKTKAAIRNMVNKFNSKLKLEYCSDPDKFRKDHELELTQNYRSVTIKNSETNTLMAAIQIFGGSLHRNAYTRQKPDAFYINNSAVARQMNTNISTRTVQRHFRKLLKAGLIAEKIFRGTKASFELIFNPEIIHLKPNSEYNFLLIELYKAHLGQNQVNPKVFAPIYSYSGTLANFPLGYTTTECRLNSTSILLQVHKINIECGLISHDFPPPTIFSENHGNENFLSPDENKDRQKAYQTPPPPPFAAAPPPPPGSSKTSEPFLFRADGTPVYDVETELDREYERINGAIETAQKNIETLTTGKTDEDKLWKYVLQFYSFAVSLLWKDRLFTEYERNFVCSRIFQLFKRELGDKPVEPGVLMFRGEFMLRILLTQKYLKRNPFWNLQQAESYFDPDSKTGFNGTASWVEKTKKMEQENKAYLSHYRVFVQAWKDFTKDPSVGTYQQCVQRLGKLKSGEWVDSFNGSIANLNQFNPDGIKRIWKQHYKI